MHRGAEGLANHLTAEVEFADKGLGPIRSGELAGTAFEYLGQAAVNAGRNNGEFVGVAERMLIRG